MYIQVPAHTPFDVGSGNPIAVRPSDDLIGTSSLISAPPVSESWPETPAQKIKSSGSSVKKRASMTPKTIP